MNIQDLTLRQIREIQGLGSLSAEPDTASYYPVEKNVIVRTVTMIYTGKLMRVTNTDLVLTQCSWIPETERFAQFVAEGRVRECEPYPDDLQVFINRSALLDLCELRAELPRTQR